LIITDEENKSVEKSRTMLDPETESLLKEMYTV